MWPDLAKFRHFGKILQVFGKFLMVYFLFGKIYNLLFQICCTTELIFIVANGQILKHNVTIWSHWHLLIPICVCVCKPKQSSSFPPHLLLSKTRLDLWLDILAKTTSTGIVFGTEVFAQSTKNKKPFFAACCEGRPWAAWPDG